MNHSVYMASLKKKTVESLRYIIKDCQGAIACFPQGENSGYYQDEIHYCCMELKKREVKK